MSAKRETNDRQNPLRQLPGVDQLLNAEGGASLEGTYGHALAVEGLRHALDKAREKLRADDGGEPPTHLNLTGHAAHYLSELLAPTLRPVINATGVVVHTNLGRAPLSDAARAAIDAVAGGYSTLEYDLEAGARGSRAVHAERTLIRLTGAEAALVVNNNAAAVLLMLTVLAKDKGVIISRGQLVEIGGGFRVPDVMAQSGARLVEVGTTNRTHLRDYEAAIDEETALIMRAHASNFKIVGFTTEPSIEDLVALSKRHNLRMVDDLGSGALLDTADFGMAHEPMAQESIDAGADVVAFSGDKLLGGPQAGILVGRKDAIDLLKRHPLARAIRADKLCLAGLAATLNHYTRDEALAEIPIWRMITSSPDELRERANRWTAQVKVTKAEVIDGLSTVGGGSLPGETLPTALLALEVASPDKAAATLRAGQAPIIARIEENRLLLDPRTVLPRDEEALLAALKTLG
jgi:L-seryl-tRNA(Ser) seleniumtransferase